MHILIAEDDTALAGFVRKGLEAKHYAVDVSNDSEQARALSTELEYGPLILDRNLPCLAESNRTAGPSRKSPKLPILVLTAPGRVDDGVTCLDPGADDYMVKPFSFAELSARMRPVAAQSVAFRAAVGSGRLEAGSRGSGVGRAGLARWN